MNRTFNNKIKQSYDNIADTWHEKREWYLEKPALDETITHLQPGASVLDVGCGSAKPIAAYLAQCGFDVYGVDISPKLIQYAEQIIPKEKLFVSDICDFETKLKFDAIICWFTLFHIHATEHLEVLRKFYSLLKSEGLLLITFADTSHAIDTSHIIIDEHTIESEMFGERFCHSGRPASENIILMKKAGFNIITDKIDQPGNQVVLSRKGREFFK